VVLSTLGSIVLFSLVVWFSPFFENRGESPAGPIVIYVVLIGVPAIYTLPVTFPLSLIAWTLCHLVLFESHGEKRRVYAAAALAGLSGSLGFLALVGTLSGDITRIPKEIGLLVYLLVPAVIFAALGSAKMVYFSPREEFEL